MTATRNLPTAPSAASILGALTQPRILDLARLFGVRLRSGSSTPKPKLASLLGAQLVVPSLIRELGREELQVVCRAHGVPDASTSRRDLIERLLLAAGFDPGRSEPPPSAHHHDGLPQPGQVVRARHRQWLVEDVRPGEGDESALVHLVCLDDDDPGRPLDVLWDLELTTSEIRPIRDPSEVLGTQGGRSDVLGALRGLSGHHNPPPMLSTTAGTVTASR